MSAAGRIVWGGLTMGPGTQYAIADMPDLDDMPEIRSSDVDRGQAHGTWTGADYTGARIITLSVLLRGQDPADLGRLVTALRAAVQPCAEPQQLQFVDRGVMVWAKPRRRSIPYDAATLLSSTTAHLMFYCADPLVYSLTQHSLSTTAYAPASGRSYPRTYPWVYGTGGTAGTLQCVNAGGTPTYPLLRIDGPTVNPTVQLTETGAVLVLNATLGVGEFALIDTSTRAVLHMGTIPRRDWITGIPRWPVMQPGTNTLVYRASPYGDGTQPTYLTVTWRDATL
ncbi:phage distal tail protein [Kitasatospora sp. CB01950]|uniref:phage distal tail protein n=1 Tax=Kitasatospora sp. CB01950 TaxID=1703930 RepID=UPI00093EF97C|nr:phage tail domain-containing protein [Kitasatospora sp. CB01950]OKJ06828.1 hypothetical protein AMK19_23555 [Kitasatospora sp. CB01950]